MAGAVTPVVHENVQGPVGEGRRPGHGCLGSGPVAYVQTGAVGRAARRGDLPGDRRRGRRVDIGDEDGGAGPGERVGDGGAYAAPRLR